MKINNKINIITFELFISIYLILYVILSVYNFDLLYPMIWIFDIPKWKGIDRLILLGHIITSYFGSRYLIMYINQKQLGIFSKNEYDAVFLGCYMLSILSFILLNI